MKFGIVVFPATNCDHDTFHVVTTLLNHEATFLWHKDTDLCGSDCVILPGGFSYGDYLRCGAMAARSPIMSSVVDFAKKGGLVFGICNGFQILVEAGLLPGALMRNRSLTFLARDVYLRVENERTAFTRGFRAGEVVRMPIAHMEGNYFLEKKQLSKLEQEGRILFRYATADGMIDDDANPNGSLGAVAGITNERGNVCGMMPHPERCAESLLGNRDGIRIFQSVVASRVERART